MACGREQEKVKAENEGVSAFCVLAQAHQFRTLCVPCWAPLSMEFSRQEDGSVLPFLTPGIKPTSLAPPALANGFFTTLPPGKPCEYLVRTLEFTL